MARSQLAQSRFSIRRATGAPIVCPWRIPAERFDAIFFDLLPAAAPVAQLAAVQFAVDEVEIHAQAGGQA